MEQILKGWSTDQKYFQKSANGPRLVRIAKKELVERKVAEFNWMKQVSELGVPIPNPISIEIGEEVTSTFTWCEGDDLRDQLPSMYDATQFDLGVEAGKYLRIIHSLQAPDTVQAFDIRYDAKINRKIEQYNGCSLSYQGDQLVLRFIEKHRNLIKNRLQTFQHGDFHTGNMVLSGDGKLSIIDFDRFDFGDPWEEFNRVAFSAEESPAFATGQITGYFDGEPPKKFFELLALYMAVNSLSGLPWALVFGEDEIKKMTQQAEQMVNWYEGMTTVIPTWYQPERYVK